MVKLQIIGYSAYPSAGFQWPITSSILRLHLL